MKKNTHYRIARLSVENIIPTETPAKSRQLSKWAFYFGTILPDLSFTQFTHPHYYEKSSDYVFNKLYKIENKPAKGIRDAIKLGEMVHYLCDFCCFAHLGGSIGKISEHLQYERNIGQYVLDNYCSLQKIIASVFSIDENTKAPIEQIKYELEDYRNKEPGFDWDIMKSVRITAIIYFDILRSEFA